MMRTGVTNSVPEKLNGFLGDDVNVQIMIYKLALERECFL